MKLPKKLIKKGQILMKEGDQDRSMFYILSGKVSVLAKIPHRNRRDSVNELVAGDLIGELSFFDGRPRSATLVALEDTEVLVIEKTFFDGLKPDHAKIFMAMVKKIRHLNDIILEFSQTKEED